MLHTHSLPLELMPPLNRQPKFSDFQGSYKVYLPIYSRQEAEKYFDHRSN